MSDVIDFFYHHLPDHITDFRPNQAQTDYVASVERALQDHFGQVSFVQGDTGIGKTLAYLLVLADWQSQEPDRKVIVSTHSKALQRQVADQANQDLVNAHLRHMGRDPITFAVRMGKGSYLNQSRLAQALGLGQEAKDLATAIESGELPPDIEPLVRWGWHNPARNLLDIDSSIVPSGFDLSEVGYRDHDVLPPELELHLANAIEADIVVVNHALLVNWMAYGQIAQREEKGESFCLLLDEAEHFPVMATQILSQNISLHEVLRLTKDFNFKNLAEEWGTAFERFRDEGLAGEARPMSEEQSQELIELFGRLSERGKFSQEDLSDSQAAWNSTVDQASSISEQMRDRGVKFSLSYSDVEGWPSVRLENPFQGGVLKAGMKNRCTIMTSATLSDMSPQRGVSYKYMRSLLGMAENDARIGLQSEHRAVNFGRLNFTVDVADTPPMVAGEDGYEMSDAYCCHILSQMARPIDGRTLVLCFSYADQSKLSVLADDDVAARLVLPNSGRPLNDIAEQMPRNGILVTPAGWEGLSPERRHQPFWDRIIVVRNPNAPLSQDQIFGMASALKVSNPDMSWSEAWSRSQTSQFFRGRTQALHKVRQGLGRAIRHSDDECEIVICDPRFLDYMEAAIPGRFRPAYREALKVGEEQELVW